MDIDIAQIDEVLATTRAVRRRLDLDRPVGNQLLPDCIDLAEQAPDRRQPRQSALDHRARPIGLGTNLIGTDDLVRDRLRRYRDAGITTLRANLHGDPHTDLDRQLAGLGRLLDLVRAVNDETTQPRTST